jgi:glycosyltransferase involved in cell wall biosynthesis
MARSTVGVKAYRRLVPEDPYCQCSNLQPTLRYVLGAHRYKCIVSIADPLLTHRIVMKAAAGSARRVYWFMDPVSYPGPDKSRWLAFRRRRCESIGKACVERGDLCVAPTSEILENISAGATVCSTLAVLPHFFSRNDWPFPPKHTAERNLVTILHAGALYWKRRPDLLVGGFCLYRRNEPVPARLRMLGSCAPEIRESLGGIAASDSISLEPGVTNSEARLAMQSADVLCIIDCDIEPNVHLPSKVADYVGACKPILYVGRRESPTCRLLRHLHPAFEEANTPEEVSAALTRLAEQSRRLPREAYGAVYGSLEATSVLAPLLKIVSAAKVTANSN